MSRLIIFFYLAFGLGTKHIGSIIPFSGKILDLTRNQFAVA
jgi:hypothetical protein